MENVMMRSGGFPKRYTLGEEVMNAVTHGVGALLAVAGGTLLIASSASQQDPYKLASSIVYGLSLAMLYLMSTLDHRAGASLGPSGGRRRWASPLTPSACGGLKNFPSSAMW